MSVSRTNAREKRTYYAPREDVHPENNAKDARNNALLRLFALLVLHLFNKKSGMVFKFLLVIQSTNQRSEKVGLFVWEKRKNPFLKSIQTTRRRSKDERSRAKTTGFFPTSKRKRDDEVVVVVVVLF